MTNWPWPLDGAQGFFEGMWNGIVSSIGGIVNQVSGWIWNAISWLKDRVTEVGSWIWNQIKPLLGPVAEWVEKAAAFVAETFLEFVSDPIGFIGRAVGWIGDTLNQVWNSLATAVNAVGSSLIGALGAAKDALGRAITGIATTVSGLVGGAVNTLSTMFNGAMGTIAGWVSDALAGVAKALGEALAGFMAWLVEKLGWIAQSIIGIANAVKSAVVGFFEMVGRELVAMVTTIFSPHSPKQEIRDETETAFRAMVEEIERMTSLPRSSLPPYEALATAVVSVASRFLMLKLAVEGVGAAVDAAHPIKGLKAHEIASGLMAIVDMPGVIGPLLLEPIRQGIMIPWSQYWASRYTPQVPGPTDLIRFVVREVMTPDEFYATMPLHGFNQRWAKAYWDAHWVLPAFTNLVDAYHRGVITRADLDKFIVWHDYSPTPRPGVSKTDLEIMRGVIKTLIPRVDLRRGWELGAISDEELVRRYEMLGYEEDSELMAEIQKREAMDAEIGKLRDNAKADFTKGYITEADLRSTLKTLGYGPAAEEYHVQDAVQDRERRRKDLLVDNYVDAYIKGVIESEDELARYLSEIIVDPEMVALTVEDAYIRRYRKPRGA